MKRIPMIGISASINNEENSMFLHRTYMRALTESGAIPVMLSYDMTDEQLAQCLDRLDAVMCSGGNDVDPALYGDCPVQELGEVNPPRDAFEVRMVKEAVKRKMPVFGICRGIQMMNAATGGTLWQDLPSQFRTTDGNKPVLHSQNAPSYHSTHEVRIEEGSRLHEIIGTSTIRTNTYHHQAVRQPAPGAKIVAYACDGVPEAIESEELPYFIGVQWHPERQMETEAAARAVFASFVKAAAEYRDGQA